MESHNILGFGNLPEFSRNQIEEIERSLQIDEVNTFENEKSLLKDGGVLDNQQRYRNMEQKLDDAANDWSAHQDTFLQFENVGSNMTIDSNSYGDVMQNHHPLAMSMNLGLNMGLSMGINMGMMMNMNTHNLHTMNQLPQMSQLPPHTLPQHTLHSHPLNSLNAHNLLHNNMLSNGMNNHNNTNMNNLPPNMNPLLMNNLNMMNSNTINHLMNYHNQASLLTEKLSNAQNMTTTNNNSNNMNNGNSNHHTNVMGINTNINTNNMTHTSLPVSTSSTNLPHSTITSTTTPSTTNINNFNSNMNTSVSTTPTAANSNRKKIGVRRFDEMNNIDITLDDMTTNVNTTTNNNTTTHMNSIHTNTPLNHLQIPSFTNGNNSNNNNNSSTINTGIGNTNVTSNSMNVNPNTMNITPNNNNNINGNMSLNTNMNILNQPMSTNNLNMLLNNTGLNTNTSTMMNTNLHQLLQHNIASAAASSINNSMAYSSSHMNNSSNNNSSSANNTMNTMLNHHTLANTMTTINHPNMMNTLNTPLPSTLSMSSTMPLTNTYMTSNTTYNTITTTNSNNNNNNMLPSKKKRISSTNPRYDWSVHYQALLHYCDIHGHCKVPRRLIYTCELYKNPDSPLEGTITYIGKLGRWLDDQRKAKKGKRSRMMPEREQQLQKLVDEGKMLWDATELKPNEINKKRGDANWPRAYAALLKYGEIHGHYNVPKRCNFKCDLPDLPPDENGSTVYDAKLGNWLYWQRELKKGKRGGLAPDREALLQKLADQGKLMWDVSALNPTLLSKQRGDEGWPKAFAALLKYCEENGTCNVPDKRTYTCILPDGETYHGNLGNWLSWQRALRKGKRNVTLLPEREKLLQQLVDEGKFRW